uniref:DUF642 domain-containing protein n=1 Tax=Mesocestoides corti TaxID=53468 RepID=A0A5K3G7T6_MESCO
EKGGIHRWSQPSRGRYTPFRVLLVLITGVVLLTVVTNVGNARTFLVGGSSRNGECTNTYTTHISYEWSTEVKASLSIDDHENHDGFRHLASNKLDHGRAPPRPATGKANF